MRPLALAAILAATCAVEAQTSSTPISYQGVAADASGTPRSNEMLNVRMRILNIRTVSTILYEESHDVVTSAEGLFSVDIGGGTPVTGDFSSINWSAPTLYLQVGFAKEGVPTFLPATPFRSTPYAHFAVDANGTWSETGTRLTHDGNVEVGGRLGVQNSNPDEELVVGTNLGSGWAVPAATVGGATGGAIEVGTSAISLSASASTTFGRARLVSTNANGFGQGLIEVRTRQLNVGRSPGVNTTRTYPLRVVQNISGQGGNFGLNLINGTNASSNWELFVTDGGDLALYSDEALRGQFDSASGAYTAVSDARLKTDVRPSTGDLARVLNITPSRYRFTASADREFVGVIAQQVREVFPEAVSVMPARSDGEPDVLVVDYNQLTALALGAVREQQARIDALEARLARLEAGR